MLLSQRKTKYQKQHSRNDKIKTLNKLKCLKQGNFGIFFEQAGKINKNQIKTILLTLRRLSQRQLKVWVYTNAFRTVTKKPSETRLGRGKGNVKYWNAVEKPGSLLLEVKTMSFNTIMIKRLIQKLKYKMSLKTMHIYKNSRWIL